MYLYLLVIVFALLVVLRLTQKPSIVWTCTTFFDCPKRDSWQMFTQGIDGLLALHDSRTIASIDRWIVVNEYSETRKHTWPRLMKQKYPFITFIQKENKEDSGQVKSLNLLFSLIQPYKYWFHWEEGWRPTYSFLGRSIEILESTNISQLQLTSEPNDIMDWMFRTSEVKTCDTDYCIISHTKEIDNKLGPMKIKTFDAMCKYWPLYSLKPSLNRVAFYNFGSFSEDKFPYPLVSEYDFAERWYKRGGIKAVFKHGPLIRPDNYISTH